MNCGMNYIHYLIGTHRFTLKFAFLKIICLKQQRNLTKSMKGYNHLELIVAQLFKKFFPSMESESLLPSAKWSPIFLQSALSKWLLSFAFTGLNYSRLFRWSIKRQVSTFHKFFAMYSRCLGNGSKIGEEFRSIGCRFWCFTQVTLSSNVCF